MPNVPLVSLDISAKRSRTCREAGGASVETATDAGEHNVVSELFGRRLMVSGDEGVECLLHGCDVEVQGHVASCRYGGVTVRVTTVPSSNDAVLGGRAGRRSGSRCARWP